MAGAQDWTVTAGSGGLEVRGMRKSYRRRPVIRDVSMRLDRGEVVALLGPNGSGKTTSFYCIAGLIMPEGGQVLLDGRDVTGLPMYRRARLGIGYLPQEVSIFRGLSVENNILAVLETRKELDSLGRRQLLEELLEELNIGHIRDGKGLSLSGGERRRVEIARALAANPRRILLDEPCSALDPGSTLRVEETIVQLSESMTIVMVTHNMQQAARVSDYCAFFLSNGGPGRLVEADLTSNIFSNPKDQRTADYVQGRFG